MLDRHFVRSTINDDGYQLGPKVALKVFNNSETVSLTVSEFITPIIFFACESATNIILDRHINLLYDSMTWPFKFTRLPEIGTTCVGRYAVDNRWYRARVVNKNDVQNTVDLLFIDYGNIGRSVKLENIRKLEGTLSTQFSSFMNCKKLNSQGAMFGFIGVLPSDESNVTSDILKDFEMKQIFDFQIVSVPLMKANIKNDLNINVPFYLIKNNKFNKDISTNYREYLINELKWETCNIDESLQFLVKSFKVQQHHFKNINILLPSLLLEFHNDFNNKTNSVYSLDGDDDGRECVTPNYSDGNYSEDENEGSILSDNGRYKCENNAIICTDDEKINIKENEIDVDECKDAEIIKNDYKEERNNTHQEKKEDEKYQGQNEDEIDTSCSIVRWKMTSILVKSTIHGLEWHLPLPEDPTFKAIITSFNDKLEFHINICSKDITSTFENMEKQLLKHFVLCNDSMLKHYVTSNSNFSNGTLCLATYKSTYIRCFVFDSNINGDVNCKLIDYGDEIIVNKSDLIPISDQFCQIPPLAVKCVLSGLCDSNSLRNYFHSAVEDVDYQVLISLCMTDKMAHFERMENNMVIVESPIPVEVFIMKLNDKNESNVVSVNEMLMKIKGEEMIDNDGGDTERELNLCCADNDEESGMNDIFLNENLHQQANMNNQDNKRPVCEYFRSKGRCFKGSKCQDRHVAESDESDNDSEDWKMMEKMHYLDDDFERQLIIGSVIGMRVSAIYTSGIFYAYLTHDINGFIDDIFTYPYDDNEDYDDVGLEFKSLQDMEANLREFLKFQQVNVDKRFDLPVNTMVVVSEDDMVHRGSIRRMISDNRYQVFLIDYGVPVEANIKNISLLPKKYISKFKQQCFMCKLNGVSVTANDSEKFANWFFERVNRKVLHCKVVDIDQEGTNYVELYNFIENMDLSLNAIAKKLF